jgi:hypothetical protein
MWIVTMIVVTILIILAFIVLSPAVLGLLSGDSSYWTRLGNIGQTYGAASTLISVLALTGVAGSLFFQAREAKANRDQALRSLHLDLMKMAMEDETYARAWGPFFDNGDHQAQRQHMYVNLIIEHWRMMCEFGSMTEEHLRSVAHVVFQGEPGRRFWANGRELRMRSSGSAFERRFHQVLDEEYRKALAEGPAVAVPVRQSGEHRQTRPSEPHGAPGPWRAVLGGAAAGFLAGLILRRRRKGRGR